MRLLETCLMIGTALGLLALFVPRLCVPQWKTQR